ncbi:alpha-ketoglutarate-dependent dioxygenase AlkB [Cognatishimia sp. WU-CL00825]|uniref:alpha-ketoglutarate-dependent dioxygenase AlkB family protein n=1 Tax=Cognatishimia sp. WU-CL00825 TaxID=3127658 RepID=UPI00310560C7
MKAIKPLMINGFEIHKGFLSRADQAKVVQSLRHVVSQAPLVSPVTPSGKPMTVRQTSAGKLGWVTDTSGYRYQATHPNGTPWPAVPSQITAIWQEVTQCMRAPDSCLVNFYTEHAKMGLHQDKDEGNFDFPVVSISLGDDALFRMGHVERGGKTESIWLSSGDVVVMGGAARLAYHGIDKLRFGSSGLLTQGGRVNVTLRVVDQGASEQQPS